LYRFAPWIRKVYIVTDNQIPSWFDRKNDWAIIVDHTDIFEDKSALPTFNSNAIETQLHRIPGLSENYLYFNDDFFLGRPCTKQDFFSKDGKPLVFIVNKNRFVSEKTVRKEDQVKKKINEYQSGMVNSKNLVYSKTGKYCKYTLAHGIKIYKKSLMTNLAKDMEPIYSDTARKPFRTYDDIQSFSIHAYYAIFMKLGVPTLARKMVKRIHVLKNFNTILSRFLYVYVNPEKRNVLSKLKFIQRSKPFMFCINDEKNVDDSIYKCINNFLDSFLPDKSPAEKLEEN